MLNVTLKIAHPHSFASITFPKSRSLAFAKMAAYSALAIVTLLNLTACNQTPKYSYIEGETMGTSYHIRYQLPESSKQKGKNIDEQIKTSIDTRLAAINDSMSTYQDDSTISKFNALPSGQPIAVDDDFIKVLQDAKQVYNQSGGAFDPTVMPLIKLWGFGKTQTVDRLQSPPNAKEIAQAHALIDFDSINLTNNMLAKTKDGVQLDFSAIAKGYGVDVIADVLHSDYQVNNYMVEIGGEVATAGVNPQSQPWQIAIDAPVIDSSVSNRQTITVLRQPSPANKMHLATSGNYRNSVVFDGVRYSHTIDPLKGQPIVGGAPSVSVIADSVSLADAWATALTAMPYHKALNTANENNISALFIIAKDDKTLSDGASINNATSTNKSNPSETSPQNTQTLNHWQLVETDAMKQQRKNQSK